MPKEADAQNIFDAWHRDKPLYPELVHYYDSQPRPGGTDGTFNVTFEYRYNGWRYIIQAHVHIEWGGKTVVGNTYIPSYDDWSHQTPDWVVLRTPQYDADTHKKEWYSNTKYRDKLYAGNYRDPVQV
ncbi:hypothetical protein Cs7R123_50750 [Catellatospora sp. TT07R-123]|uniref:hypothetical protein n=1 Tax=Catellatospora sp. TT07R-123 TaxID=2733863 RepID=UPI001B00909D|nr:hypothetical protein [Catellatospora sp. TT07R-123]GHJ47733.1 hypothetical protein Cs7R123_50750 [Catellatospora sp. TT07R-123]